MKRNLSMLLAGLLVLVMASPLYAAPDIKVNGQIRNRLRYWVDLDLDSNAYTGGGSADRRYFDNRTRLGVDAKLSDGVRAVIQLEKYFDWGNTAPNSAQTAGLATPGNSPQDPYVRQAWVDFAIPGLQEEGIRLQLGRSFFRVGNGYVWGNSLTGEDGVTLYGPLGPGDFKIRFAMTTNQSPAQAGRQRMFDNEVNHWAVDYKFDVAEKQNVELYIVGQADKAVDGYSSTLQTATTTVRHGNEYWFGGAYTGVAGPVALRAEGVYQFGTARKDACATAPNAFGEIGPAGPVTSACVTPQSLNVDRSAFFGYGEATYKVTPAWNLGLAFTFATGDDNHDDDTYDNFVAPLAEWTTSPTRVWTDSQFFYGNRTGRAVGNATTNRIFNFWGRGTEDVDASFSTGDNGTPYSPGLFELLFKTAYTFNKEVTGLFNVIPTWAANHPDGSGRYMGTEIDGKIGYKPYENLVINGYFGVFFPGSFFDQGGALRAATVAAGLSPTDDTAWMFRTEAVVSF